MTSSRLLELAKQGSAPAIATLLNQQLQAKGISAIASRQGHCLRLLLEAETEPRQGAMEQYLQHAFTKLEALSIQQIEVYGRAKGSLKGWQTLLCLSNGSFEPATFVFPKVSSQSFSRRTSQSAQSSPAISARTSAKTSVRTSTQTLPQPVVKTSLSKGWRQSFPQFRRPRFLQRLQPAPTPTPQTPKPPTSASPLRSFSPQTPIALPKILSGSFWKTRTSQMYQQTMQVLHRLSQGLQDWVLQPIAEFLGIWLQWQIATFAATLVTGFFATVSLGLIFFGIFSLFNRIPETQEFFPVLMGMMTMIPIAGLLLGDAQTRLLQRWLRPIGAWRWLTMVGFMLGFGVALGMHFLICAIVEPLLTRPNPEFVIGVSFAFIAVTIAVGLGFGVLGALQWLPLRARVPQASQWMIINPLGAIASWILGMLIAGRWLGPLLLGDRASGSSFWSTLGLFFGGGLLSWLIFHLISGVTMAQLLRRLPRLEDERL